MSLNQEMAIKCKDILGRLKAVGMTSCILKGCGVGCYYGKLAPYRESGDIDVLCVWLRRKKYFVM